MPAPFVGLSIFIHALLILIFKIFRLAPNRWRLEKSYSLRTWLGSAIIIGIFSFVSASAVYLVRADIMEKHSAVIFFKDNAGLITDMMQTAPQMVKIAEAR